MRPKVDVLSQLTDFRAWALGGADPGRVTLLDYVGFVSTPDLLFGFAELFFPDLVVHEGRRFLASGFSIDTYEQWLNAGRTPEEIQRVMNHLHISTLLQQQNVSDEVAVEAARIVAQVWFRTLGPEGVAVESGGAGLEDAAVTFFDAPKAQPKTPSAPGGGNLGRNSQ